MSFHEEATGYAKTVVSDLQGAWENLRASVVESSPFPECERLLFHIGQGMNWECVRDLCAMSRALLLIHNIASQAEVSKEIMEWIVEVLDILDEVVDALTTGRIK